MADLSAYIAFSAALSKSDTTSAITLTDPDNYPPGVDIGLKGFFVITQPDLITITGSFITPDIEWNGSSLPPASKELRLRVNGAFQQGLYTIEYHVIAPGYNETVLTKTLILAYTSPALTVTENFDVFTPDLSLTDDTTYAQSGMTTNSVSRSWEADIITVLGTPQNIVSTLQTFDLNYLGLYYDSRYDASLVSTVTYTLDSPSTWVTIVDVQTFTHTYYAFIPLSIDELLELLTAYKAQVDAGGCICGTGCCSTCTVLKTTYTLAMSIYTHIVERGRAGEIEGLSVYVVQLQKLLSNCVTPAYTNTNGVIPPYNWLTIPGSGTVTSFAAGNLPPLFTTNVATPTTTPTLSFVQINAPANSLFGNFTGAPAPPAFNTGPLPGTLMNARNGNSVDTSGAVVLGQDEGEAGNPGALLSNREIPTNDFGIFLRTISSVATLTANRIAIDFDEFFANGSFALTAIGTGNFFILTYDGTAFQIQNNIGAAIRIANNMDMAFGGYPDTRDDGVTSKVLYTSASGGLLLGSVSSQATRVISPKTTSPVVVSATADLNKVFTNEGAAGSITFQLPAAAAGLTYTFVSQNVNAMVVIVTAGDTIRLGGNINTTTNTTEVGSTLCLVAINATEWISVATEGTWVI